MSYKQDDDEITQALNTIYRKIEHKNRTKEIIEAYNTLYLFICQAKTIHKKYYMLLENERVRNTVTIDESSIEAEYKEFKEE